MEREKREEKERKGRREGRKERGRKRKEAGLSLHVVVLYYDT